MTRWLASVGLALAGFAAIVPPARAQERTPSREARLKSAFADIADRYRFSVGRVEVDGKLAAYGVLVRDNRLLTVAAALPLDPDGAPGPDGAPDPDGPPATGEEPATPGLRVQFQGDARYPARVVARDERWNLALLAVTPDELVDPVPVAQAVEPVVGQWVIAVGASPIPIAVGATSAVNRAVVEAEAAPVDIPIPHAAALIRGGRRYREVFQHDSTLPPDAPQGMPLFDSGGRFLGVSVETRTRGTSYAIPARRIQAALPGLLAGRSTAATRPGFIGIQGGFLAPAEAERLGVLGGVPVSNLIQIGGEYRGAAKAGIKVGDVIVKVDGQDVLEIQSLQEVVQLFNPGEQVVFRVLRDGTPLDFTVTIEERPAAGR